MEESYEIEVVRSVFAAIKGGNLPTLRRLFAEHPEFLHYSDASILSWLHHAARFGNIEIAEMLLEMGADIDKVGEKDETSALERAMDSGHLDMAKYLLSRGADPNIGRPLIGAINIDPPDLAMQFVELLVEHGADVNRLFDLYGDWSAAFTPLDWALDKGATEIATYLRSKGAVTREQKSRVGASEPKNLADEVVAYFREQFGPVEQRALIEIVPFEPSIAVHVIPAVDGRKHITLFTTGMSEKAMIVPDEGHDYRFAELFIQLPGSWPLTRKALEDPNLGWPITWLRWVAKYPHQQKTWLGGPVTILANDDPPQPLAPDLKFTSLLLLAEKDFVSREGRKIQLYRMTPLYTEERELEIKQGIGALLRAFDEVGVPFVVDLNRRNVTEWIVS